MGFVPRGKTTVLGLAFVLVAAAANAQEPCQVIVNPANPAMQIQRAAVVAIYLGQMTRWRDGKPITPVDQSTRSPVREAFSEKVLRRPIQSVQVYWLRKISADRSMPPPVKGSDADVVAYVRANQGAIGYVADGFVVDASVKVLRVVDDGPDPKPAPPKKPSREP